MPPLAAAIAVPVPSPLQSRLVGVILVIAGADEFVIVAVVVLVQEFTSVIVIVYVAAARLLAVVPVALAAPDHQR